MERLSSAKWDRFTTGLERENRHFAALKGRFVNLLSTAEFCDQNGIETDSEYLQEIYDRIQDLERANRATNLCYYFIQTNRAAAADTPDGDFSIVTAAGNMTPEEIAEASIPAMTLNKTLGFPPVLVAGIAVTALITGAIVTVALMETRRTEIEAAVKAQQIDLESQIAQSPELIPEYTKLKQATHDKIQSGIDSILGEGTGKMIGGIAALGIAIAIGMMAFKASKRKTA